MITYLMQAAAAFLLLILIIGLAMLFRMKGRSERIMVTQFLATVSVGWLMLEGYLSAKTYLFDVGLIFALLATLTTVAFVRYKDGKIEEEADADRS